MPKPLKLIAVAALASCAAARPSQGDDATAAFLCDGGYYFWVEYLGPQARISTSAGSVLLDERPSSIGRRFASASATFIHDDDRAALNGVPGGPFRRCRQVGPDNSAGLPPLPEAVELDAMDDERGVIVPLSDDEPS